MGYDSAAVGLLGWERDLSLVGHGSQRVQPQAEAGGSSPLATPLRLRKHPQKFSLFLGEGEPR
jgi:hypothetical protein